MALSEELAAFRGSFDMPYRPTAAEFERLLGATEAVPSLAERPPGVVQLSPRLNKRADIETQLLHVACIASTVAVAAGGVDPIAAAGGCTDGCHATSAPAANTASEATRTTRWIGVGLALRHEVQEGMTVSPVKVDEMLDLHLG